jgi:hypothetical protein
VLAVALALMALVASLTSAAGHRRPKATAHAPSAGASARPGHQASRGSTATTTAPGAGVTTAPSPSTDSGAAVPAADDEASSDTAGGQSEVATTVPATSPGDTASAAVGSGSAAAAGAGAAGPSTTTTTAPAAGGTAGRRTATDPGYLSYPDDVSAAYPVASAGPVTATASWSGGADLSLAVTCPGRQDQVTGASTLTATVGAATSAAGADTCTVTVAEEAGTEATVSYSLTVEYTQA